MNYTKLRPSKRNGCSKCPKCGRVGQHLVASQRKDGLYLHSFFHKSEMTGIGGGERITDHCVVLSSSESEAVPA